ncbi:breast carcinoma amplified sequence 2 [Coemansia reversa NRRL 1564]|uniref:Breast carcinoma amplified sequence 2 n=1 Tax=Coemansia reversa (strain ATCC 12441 / NRRL 1564) TaxID=763665 RepID=A0A2G5BA95_COERN|nr:breast carcinoma amplified sequence 2 [Coemansia reversa NRRL 1564]|eukprot:PIA15936.1 breast carcinoma amplified sequence 2 [Coemansia reversa NRRL 1564]
MSHSDAILDSLPYIDKEYDDPIAREQVLGLIQEEMERMPPPIIPKGTSMFKNNEILRKEYERVRAGNALPPFDVERYKLEAPSDSDIVKDVDAWKRAADNAASQLEHQGMRMENLELLQNFGANAWKLSNYQKESLLASIENATRRYEEEGTHLNKERKYEQTEAGIKLRDLEERWNEGVRQCIEIQVANSQLKYEIEALEKQLEKTSQVSEK